ncbi:MAG: cysteine peptidase family C39 domain-containing protein, partial [bacterium]
MDYRTIRQSEAAECGLACLAIASGALGAEIDLTALRRRYPVSSRGLNLEEMIRIAAALDMTTRAVRCEVEELRELRTPAILHWGLNHFVVLLKVTRKGIQVQDPARGVRVPDWKEVDRKFTGVALELTRSPAFRRRKERSALNLTSLLSITPEIRTAFIHTLILSVLLQAYVIGSPFYIQLAIDEAALKGDQGLLGLLAIGFALFGIFNVGAGALRAVAMQKISALLGWDMTGRLFHH